MAKLRQKELLEELKNYLLANQTAIRRYFVALVEQNSGTFNKEGVDRVGQIIKENLRNTDLKVTTRYHRKFGNLLYFRSAFKKGLPRLLISGHTDTVFEPSSGMSRVEIINDFLRGSGSCDMKGGLVVATYALKLLGKIGQLFNVDLLLTPDEEQGSKAFRRLQNVIYRKYDYAIVLEGAGQKMEACVERKGVGKIVLDVFGRAGHSGHKNIKAANAIEEICQKIPRIVALGRGEAGTTINVGTVSGGEKLNVVASHARAEFDVRYFDFTEVDRIRKSLNLIEKDVVIKGTKTKVRLEAFSPPMIANAKSLELLHVAQKVNQTLFGKDLGVGRRGGGSDGNIISQQSVGVLDGLGILGKYIHTSEEEAYLPSINDRVLLLVGVVLKCQNNSLWIN